MDSSDADQRLEHHRQPPELVSLDKLFAATGVEHFKVRKTPIFLKTVWFYLIRIIADDAVSCLLASYILEPRGQQGDAWLPFDINPFW